MMDNNKKEIELISEIQKNKNSGAWLLLQELIMLRITRNTEELIRAKPENVQRLQGAILAFRSLVTDVGTQLMDK